MRKILVLLLMMMSLATFSQVCRKTVRLKDGSEINGKRVETIDYHTVKIETFDGSVIVCQTEDIVKPYPEFRGASELYTIDKSYRGFVSGETMVGNMLGIVMTTTHGAQLNRKIFVGGGAGMCIAEDWDDNFANFPIYADLRADFVDKKVSPFLETKIGYEFAIQGASGFYGDLSVGCRVKRVSFSFGLNTMAGEDRVSNYGHYKDSYGEYSYCEYTPVRAFNVVTRLAFEFR